MEDNEYEIGFGRPPKKHQFVKGQSGNPSGRPKHSHNLKKQLQEILNEPIQVSEDGRSFESTKQGAVLRQLVGKTLKGDVKSLETMLRIMEHYHRLYDR